MIWFYGSQDHRSVARFIGYALCAADEALKDAKWAPTEQEQKERTVIVVYCWRILFDNSVDRMKMHAYFLILW